MRAMRQGNRNSNSNTYVPTQPSKPDPSLILCPYCKRRFNPITAEKHIPICKNTINRPAPPKKTIPKRSTLPSISYKPIKSIIII